ncbi:MAG: DUF2378 family protein [Smithella sp.]|jgi:hypothetical protein
MANVKATDIVIIREMLKKKGDECINAMASALQPETFKVLKTVLSINWVPLEVEAEILQAASKLFFPDDPRPLFRLGHKVSGKQFTGIYKFFLRIPSVSFVIKNISSTWNTMNDTGAVRVDGLTSNSGMFVVSGLPELTPVQREYICGVISCILELTGVRNVNVEKVEDDRYEWKWKISWE